MRKVLAWVITVLIAVWMAVAGIPKILGPEEMLQAWDKWGLPYWLMYVVGAGEILVALTIFIPQTRKYSIMLLGVLMIGAAVTHVMNDEISQVVSPLIALFMGVLSLVLHKSETPEVE